MNPCTKPKAPFSAADRIGFWALGLAMAMIPLDYRLVMLPLGSFLLLCAVMPFIPGVGFFLPVISRGRPGRKAVALTFDDGPDPLSTPPLLDLLDRHGVAATFFVTGKRAARHPGIVEAILSRGHTLGNHSYGHDNFIMLKSSAALKKEIMEAQAVLLNFGVVPLAFRPPVGVTSPRLAGVLREMGMLAVNFSRRAGDRGNRRVAQISRRILSGLRAGDIIMLHDTRPHHAALHGHWLAEIDNLLAGIRKKALDVVPLATLIERPVMIMAGSKTEERDPQGLFRGDGYRAVT